MTPNFATAMVDTAETWNGAVSLSTPDINGYCDKRLALFFKSVRGLNIPRLYDYLRESAKESIVDTFVLVFQLRDCRGGKGERELGRKAFIWMFLNYPNEFKSVIPLIPEYGRWDDLLQLWPTVLDLTNLDFVRKNWDSNIKDIGELRNLRNLQLDIVNLVARQLINDRAAMEAGKPTSICAKWVPTENDSLDRKCSTVSTIAKKMNISARKYRREYTTPLRSYINIVEKLMCENKWDNIEFSKVPSCAMKRLKKAFEKHVPEEFTEWKKKLVKGEVEVKAKQLFPHELIYEIRKKLCSDDVCEEQWKVLEKEVENLGVLSDAICICDVSASMESYIFESKFSFTPIDVSIALSLIIANAVKGPFRNHIITFHNDPTFQVIKDGTLIDRFKQIKSIPWGGSTNLQKTFDLILNQAKKHKLKQEDMPKRVFLFSDMQFDDCYSGRTNFQEIEEKYAKSGYKRPQIIFWNLNGSSTDFPVSVDDNNTALLSGYSPSIMKYVLNGNEFSPYSILRDTIDNVRYKPVVDAISSKC